jgi:hypothetical protein
LAQAVTGGGTLEAYPDREKTEGVMKSFDRATLAFLVSMVLFVTAAAARAEIVREGVGVRTLDTEIEIDAPAEEVWAILTALDAYPSWNPFIRSASGEVREGALLAVTVQPPGRSEFSFEPKVLVVSPNRELRWRGKLWIDGLFDGEHAFAIEPLDGDRVRLRHWESFSGVLVPLLGGMLRDTEAGFQAMNAALKERAEQ